jgi:hypothetical protein
MTWKDDVVLTWQVDTGGSLCSDMIFMWVNQGPPRGSPFLPKKGIVIFETVRGGDRTTDP